MNFVSKDYAGAECPVHITDKSDKAPEIKAEKWINSDNVKANAKELGIEYPMATDNAFYNRYNYDVHTWLTIFLLDKGVK